MRILRPILAVALGLSLGLLVAWFAGESPWHVLKILANSAFGSTYDIGMSLFYSVPLVFTGLSVSLAFHAGLFNIGAEGQLTLGALAAAAVGALLPGIAWPMAPLLAGLAAFSAGAAWGAIPGLLKAHRGSHEVIITMMLNFIAAGIASYVTLYLLRNPETQNPETRVVGPGYLLTHLPWFDDAPVSTAAFLALGVALAAAVFLWKTVLGYEVRAMGASERAALYGGVSPKRIYPFVMALAGGVAGLVGVAEVLGHAGKFKLGFSPDYGFLGIAVALLGRNHPIGVVAAALLFGALHKGTADLDLETEKMTREVSLILQAFIILCVSADGFWDVVLRRRKGALAPGQVEAGT
jgi:simple sugar transport system permease protein